MVLKYAIKIARQRTHETISHEGRALIRRWVLYSSRYLTIRLHHFLASDDGPILHNHATPTLTYVLRGEYIEHAADGTTQTIHQWHRVELIGTTRPWTLFLTGRRHPQDARFLMPDGRELDLKQYLQQRTPQ
jgi:hypothetical protein